MKIEEKYGEEKIEERRKIGKAGEMDEGEHWGIQGEMELIASHIF